MCKNKNVCNYVQSDMYRFKHVRCAKQHGAMEVLTILHGINTVSFKIRL